MAKYTFNQYEEMEKENPSQSKNFVTFFSLPNDGDEAIVRFPYHSLDELELASVHTVEVGKGTRNVSCLRGSAKEPLESCPLCAEGIPVRTRVFIRVLQYVKDETGKVTPVGKVFERAVRSDFVTSLKSMFEEYGDITDIIFKIKRKGAKGDVNTTYSLVPANPAVYKPEIYVPDFSAFEGFTLFKYFILDKDATEMNTYLETGSFPKPVVEETTAEKPTVQPAVEETIPVTPTYTAPTYSAPARPTYGNAQPAQQAQPVAQPQPARPTYGAPTQGPAYTAPTRPVRTYTYNK